MRIRVIDEDVRDDDYDHVLIVIHGNNNHDDDDDDDDDEWESHYFRIGVVVSSHDNNINDHEY